MDGGTNDDFVPKGTLTPLGHPRTGGARPLDCNDCGGGKDAPTSTSVRQPSRHHRPCLIPAWPARGIFAGDSFATRCGDAGSRKRRRKGSANANLERLLRDEVRQCDVCARAVLWTPSLERRYFSGNNHSNVGEPSRKPVAESLPRFIDCHMSSASPLPCSFCTPDRSHRWCGALYCSDDCRTIGEEVVALQMPCKSGNSFTEPTDATPPPSKLFFCRNRFFPEVELHDGKSEVDGLVEEATASMAAIETRFRSTFGYDGANADTDTHALGVEECALMLATILSCTCPDTISTAMQSTDNQPLQNINADEESLVEEMWAMARAHASVYQELLKKWSGSGTAKSQPFPSYQAFAQCYIDIKRNCLLRVDAPTHSLVAYATKTIISKDALTEEERGSALDLLKCSWLDDEAYGVESSVTQSTILRWRRAAHFAHWASNPTTSSDPESKRVQALLRKSYFVYCPSMFRGMEHSCAPTLMLTIPDSSTGEQSSKSPFDRLSWLALHDVPKGDASISKLDSLESDAAVRSADFARLMGKGRVCSCIRCRHESLETGSCDAICLKGGVDSEGGVGALHFTKCEVKCLADQAMQQGRFDDASTLYNIILSAHPKDGDVLHARAASYLGRASSLPFADIGHCQGHFVKAQRLWDEAGRIEECASHPEITVQVSKQRVYKTSYQHPNGEETANGGFIAFTTHLDGRCFVTSAPVISPEECQRAIKSAEEHATKSSGGWTTSRHYAVPTTDIPIHELTSLHAWFCNLWGATICPLLCRQFQLDKPPQRDIFLHDAFLVRYDAERQRYLPPHVDESTHSFIIALNDGFKGGGTYFHTLGKTLAPSVGGMVSFCGGEVLHSGDPVVSGTRYVIAAFCYIDLAGSGADASSEKPPNLKGVFHDKGRATDSFSFGFIDVYRRPVFVVSDLFLSSLFGEDDGASSAALTNGAVEGALSSTHEFILNPLPSSRRFILLPIQAEKSLAELLQLRGKYGKKTQEEKGGKLGFLSSMLTKNR
ncbi:hypothetical protein ACHAXT_002994 [Thalassiosira profunda]